MMFTPTTGQPQSSLFGFHPSWASLFPGMSSYYQRLAHAAPAKKPGFLVADLLFTNSVSRNSERSMAVIMPSRCRTSSHSPEVEDLAHAPRSAELKFGIDRILQDSDKNDTKEDKDTGTAPVTGLGCSCHSPASPSISCTQPAFHHVALSSTSTSRYHLPVPSMHTVLYPLPKTLLHTESSSSQNGNASPPQQPKRKRSWSRAVFSNLQRKGLEKRFEVQKYVTKPDRRQLAAMLGLTDAQVKVWFQNRRMKWRHAQEAERRKREEELAVKEAESKNPDTNESEEDIVIDSDDPDPNIEQPPQDSGKS